MIKFVPILKLKDLSVGKKKKVEISGEEILVCNIGGEIYAVSDRCGHMGVSLSRGEIFDSQVECPLHGSIFDLKTGKLISDQPREMIFKKMKKDFEDLLKDFGIPPVKIKPLKTYPVEIRKGKIHVGIERFLKSSGIPPVKIKPIETYPVEIKKGRIYVGVERPNGKSKNK
ncbi:MAG: non-heme iron oxygenase ferredoxin subunit [Patescibacteria group bacterium]